VRRPSGSSTMWGVRVFALFSAVCAGVAARSSRGRARGAWLCLAIGLVGWFVGDLIWAYYELWQGQYSPFPSLADAGYLLFPVGACLAFLFFPIGHTGQSEIRVVLDGLMVAGSLFLVLWVSVLRHVLDMAGASRLAVGLSLVYPVTDLVMITVAVLVLARARTGQRATLTLLTVGIILMALSDSAFVYLIDQHEYASGSLIDLGWVAGLLVLGVAALVGCRAPQTDLEAAHVPARMAVWLPYVPLLLASVVGTVYFLPRPGSGPVLGVALMLVSAVFGPAISRGRREPAAPASAGRSGVAGPADRPGEPYPVSRPPDTCRAAAASRSQSGGGVVAGPGRVQTRQRQPRSSGRRRAVDWSRRTACRVRADRRHGRPPRRRRVRDPDRERGVFPRVWWPTGWSRASTNRLSLMARSC